MDMCSLLTHYTFATLGARSNPDYMQVKHFSSFAEKREFYSSEKRLNQMVKQIKTLNTSILVTTILLTEKNKMRTTEIASLIETSLRNKQYDMLLILVRHFTFWITHALKMKTSNESLIFSVTSLMHQCIKALDRVSPDPQILDWIEECIYLPLQSNMKHMADSVAMNGHDYSTEFVETLTNHMFYWSTLSFHQWLALVYIHNSGNIIAYEASTEEERPATSYYYNLEIETLINSINNPHSLKWIYHLLVTLKLDHMRISYRRGGQTIIGCRMDQADNTVEQIDSSQGFNPLNELAKETRIYLVVLAMIHDLEHSLSGKAFTPLTENVKEWMGWTSQVRPIKLGFNAAIGKTTILTGEDHHFSFELLMKKEYLLRFIALVMIHFKRDKNVFGTNGMIFLQEFFGHILPHPKDSFAPLMDILQTSFANGIPWRVDRYFNQPLYTKIQLIQTIKDQGKYVFSPLYLNTPIIGHNRPLEWRRTLVGCTDADKHTKLVNDLNVAMAFAQNHHTYLDMFWTQLTMKLIGHWDTFMIDYSNHLIDYNGYIPVLVFPFYPDNNAKLPLIHVNQQVLNATNTEMLIKTMSLLSQIPFNVAALFSNRDPAVYSKVVDGWCGGHVAVYMKQLARIIALEKLILISNDKVFQTVIRSNKIALLNMYHSTNLYGPLQVNDSGEIISTSTLSDEEYFWEDLKTDLLNQRYYEGPFSSLLDAAMDSGALQSYQWLRTNYHLPINKRTLNAAIKTNFNSRAIEVNWAPIYMAWLSNQKQRVKFGNTNIVQFGPQPILQLTMDQKDMKIDIHVKRIRVDKKRKQEESNNDDEPAQKKQRTMELPHMVNVLKNNNKNNKNNHSFNEEEEEEEPRRWGGKKPRIQPLEFSDDDDDIMDLNTNNNVQDYSDPFQF